MSCALGSVEMADVEGREEEKKKKRGTEARNDV